MTVSTRNSILDPKTFGNQGSRITDRRSKIENHGSKIEDENHGSKIEDRDSRIENRDSRIWSRRPRIEDREARIKYRDVRRAYRGYRCTCSGKQCNALTLNNGVGQSAWHVASHFLIHMQLDLPWFTCTRCYLSAHFSELSMLHLGRPCLIGAIVK